MPGLGGSEQNRKSSQELHFYVGRTEAMSEGPPVSCLATAMNPTSYTAASGEWSRRASWRPPFCALQKITGLGQLPIPARSGPPADQCRVSRINQRWQGLSLRRFGFGSGLPPVSVLQKAFLLPNFNAASELEASGEAFDRKNQANHVLIPSIRIVCSRPSGPASPPPSSIHKGIGPLLIWMVGWRGWSWLRRVALAHS